MWCPDYRAKQPQKNVRRDNYPPLAAGHVFLRLQHRIVGATTRSESIARFRKSRLKLPAHYLVERLLYHPVHHRRDAQLPHPASRLRDLYSLHRLWLIPVAQQRSLDPLPLSRQVSPQVLDVHPVDSRCSAVASHLPVGGEHVLPLDYLLHHSLLAGVDFLPLRRDA